MNLDQIATKCFILALFIRDDGERLLLGDGCYDFNQKLQHFQGNTIANDIVEIQGDNGQLLAGQVMRSGAQKFEGYIGDATTNRQTIEQKRSDFMAFFRIKHFYQVIYILPDGTAIQRRRGYLTDAPAVPEIFQKFPEYSVALNFEDANYYEYAEDEHGDGIYAHIIELALSGDATGGLIWDSIGAVTNGISWSGIQTAQGEYIQVTNDLDIPAKLASVEMLGKAEQTTYSGKNLIPNTLTTGTTNGLTYTPQPDGTIKLTGRATARVEPYLYNNSSAPLTFPAGTYKNTSTYPIILYAGGYNLFPAGGSLTFSEAKSVTQVYFRVEYTGTTLNETYYPQIIASTTTDETYEKYVGGTPAPNPEFPMPISVVTGENAVKIEGKNLFNQGQYTGGTNYGITTTFATEQIKVAGTTDGTHYPTYIMYADGSTTQAQWWATASAINTAKGQFTDSGTYTLSIEAEGNISGHANGFEFILGYMDGTISGNQFVDQTTKKGSFTATKPINFIAFGFRPSLTFDTTFTIQLEKGSSVSSFEPYQGQEFEVNLGKNLLDPTATLQGVWNNASSTTTCTFFTPICTGESFTISNQDTTTWRFSAGLTTNPTNNPAGTGSQISAWQTGASYTITAQSDGYLWVQLRKNANTNITPSDIPSDVFQLERGSQATSFTPHFTPIELAKIGTYQDRIYKSDGKWYIEKQVGKVVLDGTEDGWTWADTARYAIATANIGAREAISDHFTYVNYTGHASTASPSFDISSNLASIGFHDKDITSLNNFKTWLSTHPTTVYYALAEPVDEEITNEALIAQLDALESASLYLGVNNIGTETLNAVPTLKIEYYTEVDLDGAGYEWEEGGNPAKTIVTVAGVDSAWPIWTVQGGAQNPTLTNITTGQTITWQGFVPEGQTLTINMAEMTADLAGANVFEYITGEWIRLAPGNNTLVYTAGSADKPSTLSWNGVLA